MLLQMNIKRQPVIQRGNLRDEKVSWFWLDQLGFKKYGTFPDNMKYEDGSYVDAYWMMKKLGI